MNPPHKPLRVAQVIGKLAAGGVESVVYNYYKHIDKNKVQFDIYYDADSSVAPPQSLIDLGARFIQVPPYQKLAPYLHTLYRCFRAERYAIVHSHINALSVFPLMAAWAAKVSVRIAHSHSTAAKGETKKNAIKRALRPFSKVFATDYMACSMLAAEWLFGKNTVRRGKVTIVHNAIDVDNFRFNEETRPRVRHELGIENQFVVGHVGRFCYQKNHDFLVDVFCAVHQKYPDSMLLLVGEGELQLEVREKVEQLGMTPFVKFLGIRGDVADLYQAMDVLVMPSRYEGLPVVAVEAQAAGLPVVMSTEVTGEVKIHDGVEQLALIQSADEWAEAVLHYKDYADRSLKRCVFSNEGYDIEIEVKKIEFFYHKLERTNDESCD